VHQIGNGLRVALDMAEGAEECLAKMFWLLEVAVVCCLLARVIPNPFGSVKFRPVRWQLEHLHITPVLGKPLVGFLLFVVGDVVLYHEHTVASPVKRRQQDLIQKGHIGLPLEIILLVEIDELCGVQAHRAKDFLRVPLALAGNLRLAGHPRPGGIEGGRLAERRFVLKDDYRPFAAGFFLRRG
jgi:hypothetical protein